MQHAHSTSDRPPNIILIMCDDLGWGDTGFNGNTIIQTPHLDALRAESGRFTRFYAGGPVCSPTRGTCLTGRHYSRYGITNANVGHLPAQEYSLARMCREQGYRTGHFGKWHLGTLDKNHSGKPNRDPAIHYAPPWERDYDSSFATEFAVPTWDPGRHYDMKTHARSDAAWSSPYFEDGKQVEELLLGCDSKHIMDRSLAFIEAAHADAKAFMTTIWFHAPHTPVEAGPAYHALYADTCTDDEAHYYGCVTAMDAQVGRLTQKLNELGLDHNTIIFFCSDNGPEGSTDLKANRRSRGQTGGLRGRKRSLFDGGIAVPALVRWPGLVAPGSDITAPCSTLDYLPTLAAALQVSLPTDRPYDGCDIRPIISGNQAHRQQPIPYRFRGRRKAMFDAPTFAVIDNNWKFLGNICNQDDDLLFQLDVDRSEQHSCLQDHPEKAKELRAFLDDFVDSCRRSHHGADYPVPDAPADPFHEPEGWM